MRIKAFELVDVIALALQLLSRKVNQLFARIDVVGRVSVGFYFEGVGEAYLDKIAHIIAHAHQQKGVAHGDRVVSNGFNHVDGAFVAGFHLVCSVVLQLWLSHGHHVRQMPIKVKPEHQVIVYDGELCVVKKSPTDEVGKREVAILALAP